MAKHLLHIVCLVAQVAAALAVQINVYSDSACTSFLGNKIYTLGCNDQPNPGDEDITVTCLNDVFTLVEHTSTNGACTGQSWSHTYSNGVCTLDQGTSGFYLQFSGSTAGCTYTGGAAGSDPIARFGDKKVVFELPPNQLVTLASMPDSVMHGSVFEGHGPWEQWFDRVVMSTPAADRFLEIKVKDHLHERNYSKVPSDLFKTLDVTMGYGDYPNPNVIAKIESYRSPVPEGFLGYQVAFRPLKRNFQIKSVGRFPRECVDLAGNHVHLYICSSPATEYYGELHHLALKFAHLDIGLVEYHRKSLTGLLPELWGMQPMSEFTKSLIKEETCELSTSNVSVVASAGGLDVEPLMQDRCDGDGDSSSSHTDSGWHLSGVRL